MKDKGRVALARIVFANREHILAIEPWGKGMLGTTLRYDYEVRDEDRFFKGIPSPRVPKDMVKLAGDILDRKAGHFDVAKFKDEYELALRKLVKHKAAGHTIERPEAPDRPSNVINLMDALRESLGNKKSAEKSEPQEAGERKARHSSPPQSQLICLTRNHHWRGCSFSTTASYVPQLRKCWHTGETAICR